MKVMPLFLKPILFALLITWAAAFVENRFSEARGRARRDCRSFRTLPENHEALACADDEFADYRASLRGTSTSLPKAAQAAFDRGDEAAALAALNTAIAFADRSVGQRTFFATSFAANLAKATLDVAEKNHVAIEAESYRGLLWKLAGVSSRIDAHPFETMRIHDTYRMLRLPHQNALFANLIGEAYVLRGAAKLNRQYRAMDDAIARGDVSQCQTEAGDRVLGMGAPAYFCEVADKTQRTARRLAEIAAANLQP